MHIQYLDEGVRMYLRHANYNVGEYPCKHRLLVEWQERSPPLNMVTQYGIVCLCSTLWGYMGAHSKIKLVYSE